MIDTASANETAQQFEKLKPWVSRFTINGRTYGGDYDPTDDARLAAFFEHFGTSERILELGCLEGAHSRLLASRNSAQVIGVEGRAENVARAELVARLYGLAKVRFVRADLETFDLASLGAFDAVFCVGLLYHIQQPWSLLQRLRAVSSRILLATHYMPDDRANTLLENYRGRYYREFGLKDPLSGLYARSFWPDRESLLRMVADAGYTNIVVCADHTAHQYGPLITLAANAGTDVT